MRVLLLVFFLGFSGVLYAGTFMIVVVELKPETETTLNTGVLRQTLIGSIFDELFETGHIAFDLPARSLNGWTPEWRLSHIEEAEKMGATRVVIIRLEWKAIDENTWDIAELNWAVIDVSLGVELGSGTLTPTFLRQGENEERGSRRIALEMMRGMKVGLAQ